MAHYLDPAGLQYLWTKIKLKFASKVSNATAGNFAGLDASGDLTDSGKKPTDFISALEPFSTETTGHVAIWGANGHTLADGTYILQQNVLSTHYLFTPQDKQKFDSIEPGAQVNLIEHITVDGTEITPDTGKTVDIDLSGKADKVANATAGNFAGLDANGNLTDSGKKPSDFADSEEFQTLSDTVTAHTNDSVIHVTQADKNKWNDAVQTVKVDNVEVTQDTSNTVFVTTGSGVTSSNAVIIANLRSYSKTIPADSTLYPVQLDDNDKLTVAIPNRGVGIKDGEKILSFDGASRNLQTTLGIVIDKPTEGPDSGKTFIRLTGLPDASGTTQVVASVDASQFVVDGMIDDVYWDTGDTQILIISFNTDSGKQDIAVDFSKFITENEAGSGITIDNHVINIHPQNTGHNVQFGFGTDTSGKSVIYADVDLSGKIDKVTGETGEIAIFKSDGNIESSGKKPADYVEKITINNGTPITPTNNTINVTAVQSVIPGDGVRTIVGSTTGKTTIDTTHPDGTVLVALKGYNVTQANAATRDTTAVGTNNGGFYAVELDKDGNLAVRVPWYHASHALTVTNGTATQLNQGDTVTFVESVAGCTATTGDLTATTTRKTFTIPTVNNASLELKSANADASGTPIASSVTTVTTFTANDNTNKSLEVIGGHDINLTPNTTSHTILVDADIYAMTYGTPDADIDKAISDAEAALANT